MTNCAFIDYFVKRLKQFNQRICKKITYIKIRKFKIQRIKYLFILIKAQLLTISNIIPYISETNSTSSSLKKKKNLKRREEGRKGKRERDGKEKKEKGKEEEKLKKKEKRKEERKKERESAKGKENEMGKKRKKKKEKKEEKEEEEEKIEKAIQKLYRPLQKHSLARS